MVNLDQLPIIPFEELLKDIQILLAEDDVTLSKQRYTLSKIQKEGKQAKSYIANYSNRFNHAYLRFRFFQELLNRVDTDLFKILPHAIELANTEGKKNGKLGNYQLLIKLKNNTLSNLRII